MYLQKLFLFLRLPLISNYQEVSGLFLREENCIGFECREKKAGGSQAVFFWLRDDVCVYT